MRCVLARMLPPPRVFGVEAMPVSVEVDVSFGLPGITMVGLPDTTVRESRDRVRAAIRNSGFPFPAHRVTVSLAPADVRKVGAAFDLPIALGILAAAGLLPHRDDRPTDDRRRTVARRQRPAAAGSAADRRRRTPTAEPALMLPGRQSRRSGDRRRPDSVPGAVAVARRRSFSARPTHGPTAASASRRSSPGGGRRSRRCARTGAGRRALEIAAAGGHHLLLVGPPGAGKTMLAQTAAGVVAGRWTFEEALTVTAIHSVAGLLPPGSGLLRDAAVSRAAPHAVRTWRWSGAGAIRARAR